MTTILDDVRAFELRQRPRHTPGEAGVWIFILGDMSIFSAFFVTYLVYRSRDAALFNASAEHLKQVFGVINTLLLLCSSLLVVVGIRAIRRMSTTIAPWCFVGAMVCGAGFATMKFLEYGDKVHHHITPNTNEFWMYFYILTGLHFFHLLMGMGVLIYLTVKSRQSVLTVKEFAFVEGGACFWHMVDVLWIVLFPLLYFVR
ncbi:cytochrome C oxidase subunit III [Mycobacterium sp. CBMA 234]|uniref:cytochrome c oxidase subunit 3 n=1 Tax=Mycolicibacterium sp. CBMA 234 TaxID=1918495 RepID=UPI0012DC05FA|nr:cytochrome c oxidase subunit 3 [Mycolicibacterium sp. CBMA 234]MUL65935.1 cytochrome C oxidase subunit III [Mycolicibacterium sp. CBMA 234]